MRRIIDFSAFREWRLPWIEAAELDIRSDREKATEYLLRKAIKRIDHYLDEADEATAAEIFRESGMIRARDRTPRQEAIARIVLIMQIAFFSCWALTALHLLGLV